MSPQDGLALGLLATLLAAFGFLMGIFVSLARNAKREPDPVDELIAGLNEEEGATPEVDGGWERDADWWRS